MIKQIMDYSDLKLKHSIQHQLRERDSYEMQCYRL